MLNYLKRRKIRITILILELGTLEYPRLRNQENYGASQGGGGRKSSKNALRNKWMFLKVGPKNLF